MEFFNTKKHIEIAEKYFEGSFEKMIQYIYDYMFFIFEIDKYEFKNVFINFESYNNGVIFIRLYGDEWDVVFDKQDVINNSKINLIQKVLVVKERDLQEKLTEADLINQEIESLKLELEKYGDKSE